MKERPILFNDAMVRAILDGRKTQTRRPVKPQPRVGMGCEIGWIAPDDVDPFSDDTKRGQWECFSGCNVGEYGGGPFEIDWACGYTCPLGQPGDRLWVREAWNGDWTDHVIYRADGGSAREAGYQNEPGCRPSIHMPRWASRITLEVKAVRVEKLVRISAQDARSETGLSINSEFSPIPYFADVWDRIYAPSGFGWNSQPWVWVCEFEVVK